MAIRYEKRISFSAGDAESIALAEAAEKQKCSKSTIIRQLIYAHLTQKSATALNSKNHPKQDKKLLRVILDFSVQIY
jgi:hypothetical protein